MNVNDFGASGLEITEKARSLLDQATEEWRSEVTAAARREAASRGSRTVDASDVTAATYDLRLSQAAGQRRRVNARRRFRMLAVTTLSLATVAATASLVYYVSQRRDAQVLDAADQIASVVAAFTGVIAILAAFWALLQSRRAAMEAEREIERAEKIITHGDLIERWIDLEVAMQDLVGDPEEGKPVRTVGELFKKYASLAGLTDEEFDDLRSALQVRNELVHGRYVGVEPDEMQRVAAIIGTNTARARSLARRANKK